MCVAVFILVVGLLLVLLYHFIYYPPASVRRSNSRHPLRWTDKISSAEFSFSVPRHTFAMRVYHVTLPLWFSCQLRTFCVNYTRLRS